MKGQITLFIILGLFIFGATAFVLYVQSQTNVVDSPLNDEIPSKVSNYVINCLDISAKEGINKILNQGGWIYTNENGLRNKGEKNKDFITYNNIDTVIDLKKNFKLLPSLCDNQGPNFRSNSDKIITSCPSTSYFQNVQYQLKNYVLEKTKQCLKKETINITTEFEKYNINISIDESTDSLEVPFSNQYIEFNLYLPITLNYGIGKSSTIYQFSTKVQINILNLWYEAEQIINWELDPKNKFSDYKKKYNEISLERIRENNNIDLFKISDTLNIINGKSPSLIFGVANKCPNITKTDIINDQITINAYDYDEDKIHLIVTSNPSATININSNYQNPAKAKISDLKPKFIPATYEKDGKTIKTPSRTTSQTYTITVTAKDNDNECNNNQETYAIIANP